MDNKNIHRSRSDITPLLALGLVACGGGGSGGSTTATGTTTAPAPAPHGPPPPPPAPVIPPFVPPDDISLGLFENHPTNRPIYDLTPQGETDGAYNLPPSYGDNALFTVSADGRIWFKVSPDFEIPTDKNADNTYNIRVEHPHNGQGQSDIDVGVQDVAIELTPAQWEANSGVVQDYYRFTYEQVKNIPPTNDFVKYLLNGTAYALPQTGPLTLTWSLVLPSSDLTSNSGGRTLVPPDTNSQAKIDEYRQNINMAFAEFEAVANLNFVEVSDTVDSVGDIRFFIFPDAVPQGFQPGLGTPPHITLASDVFYSTYVHEIGHALSLKHPFHVVGGFPSNPEFRTGIGSERSIMSNNLSLLGEGVAGLQPADIAALQYLYGDVGTDFDGLQADIIASGGVTPVII